jgi:hypothetical protein
MKQSEKASIRKFILAQLEHDNIRMILGEWLDKEKEISGNDIDPFEAMVFYEDQVDRIDKMFCYPNQPS